MSSSSHLLVLVSSFLGAVVCTTFGALAALSNDAATLPCLAVAALCGLSFFVHLSE